MRELYIIGKGDLLPDFERYKADGRELWALGTDERVGADLYFELHSIPTIHDNVIYTLPKEVYELGIPVNNSISAMCIYAYLKGYTDIKIYGAPMVACDEYQEQRPALAYVVGWLNGKGVNVTWRNLPSNINYGINSKTPDR